MVMRTRDAEVRQQKGLGVRLYWGAEVSVQHGLAKHDVMLGHRIVKQPPEQGSGVRVPHLILDRRQQAGRKMPRQAGADEHDPGAVIARGPAV